MHERSSSSANEPHSLQIITHVEITPTNYTNRLQKTATIEVFIISIKFTGVEQNAALTDSTFPQIKRLR